MDAETVKWIVGTFVAIFTVVGGPYFAYRQAIRVSHDNAKTETLKVDAAAYERAKGLYESGIQSLEEQLSHLRKQLDEERNVSYKLRFQVEALETMVARLRRQMVIAGIEIETGINQPMEGSN